MLDVLQKLKKSHRTKTTFACLPPPGYAKFEIKPTLLFTVKHSYFGAKLMWEKIERNYQEVENAQGST